MKNIVLRLIVSVAALLAAQSHGAVLIPPSDISPVQSGVVLGRTSAGSGRAEQLTAGDGITIANGTISSTGGGGGGAPTNATYITNTPNATLTNEQPLSPLATGLMYVTTGTGAISSLGTLLQSSNGGTNNAFTAFVGPAGTIKSYTLPNQSTSILTTAATVTVPQGGTGQTAFTDGQLLIGNTGTGGLTKATLTQGSGITITNGAGSITIASTGGGSGNVTVSGTPTSGQLAEWTTAFNVQGVAATGTGSVVRTTTPTISTPTINGTITFQDGVRQTFNPNGSVAGINVGSQAGDPSAPINGDVWYDSTANELTARIGGVNTALGSGGGSGNVTASSTFGTDNILIKSDGTGRGVQATGITIADGTNDVSGIGNLTVGNLTTTDLTISGTITGVMGVTNGGTGRPTGTTAYSLVATGTTATGTQQTLANGATTEVLVGGGASALPAWTTATGTGAPVRGTSPTFTSNFTLPNSAAPTTSVVAQVAFDTNAQGTNRGSIQVHDGTANTYVVAALASDTPTNGQVLTWNTGGTMTWESPSAAAALPWYDVITSYNGSGSATQTTGTISASSPTLVVASASTFAQNQGITIIGAGAVNRTVADGVLNSTTTITSATLAFNSGDIGKRIAGTGIPANARITAVASATSATISSAATATASGVTFTIYANHVTTISSIAGTTFTLADNAVTAVTSAVVQHDETVAINAALAAAYNAGGGQVLLRSTNGGRWRVAGAFNGTTNSLLTLPQDLTNKVPLMMALVGDVHGSLTTNSSDIDVGGVSIDASDAPAGTGTNPAVFAGAPTTGESGWETAFENVDMVFDNLIMVVQSNTTISGINGSNCLRLKIGDNVSIFGLASGGVFIEPTNDSTGIIFPKTHNSVLQVLGSAQIALFKVGVKTYEHTDFRHPYITLCGTGLQIDTLVNYVVPMFSGSLCIENCPVLISKTGDGPTAIDLVMENEVALDSVWYGSSGVDIEDAGNDLRGQLRYALVDQQLGDTRAIIINGGSGLLTYDNYRVSPVTGTGKEVRDTSPVIFGPAIAYSTTTLAGADDSYNGQVITGLNAGATIAQWEAVYLGGSSTWLLADANGSGTYPARGLSTAAYSSTNPAVVVREGPVRNDAWSWTPGGNIYLSTTAGGLTQTPPATSGDKVQIVGFALTADIAYFNFASGQFLTVE